MLGHLQDQPGITAGHFQGIKDGRETLVELDVDDGTDDCNDASGGGAGGGGWSSIVPACGGIHMGH